MNDNLKPVCPHNPDNPDGELIASAYIDGNTSTSLLTYPEGVHDLVFIMKGEKLLVDKWMLK